MKTIVKQMFMYGLILGVLSVSANLYAGEDDAAKAREQQAKLIAEKKAELNNHEWEINMKSAGSKGEPQTDVLRFTGMKFESKKNAEAGYGPTNYTITLQENGPTVWETMQTSPKGKPVFWRGEWKGESMSGVINKQLENDKNEEYYFTSSSFKKVEPPVESPKPEETPAPADEVAVPELPAVPAAVETAENAVAEVEQKAAEVAAPAVEVPAVPASVPEAVAEKAKEEIPVTLSAVPASPEPKKKKGWLF